MMLGIRRAGLCGVNSRLGLENSIIDVRDRLQELSPISYIYPLATLLRCDCVAIIAALSMSNASLREDARAVKGIKTAMDGFSTFYQRPILNICS